MKIQKSYLLFLALFIGVLCNAQDDSDAEEFVEFNDRNNVVHGVYLGLTTHFGEIEKEDSYFVGLKIAYVANQQFEIGFAANVFYSEQNFITQGTVDNDLIGAYGGLHLEPIFFSKKKVNLSFPLLLGVGGIGYVTEDHEYFEDDFIDNEYEDVDVIFVLEPGINALFNVSRYLQLEAGIKYRFSNSIKLATSPIDRLNGYSVGLGIKVGVFNMGRNRYKKNIK
ncbi:hypothetical protein JQC67_12720 [Aurantibacter crassamenti]|uniref:hypothetical protein n=1 Tax=Aurantibacter crassamenti TaxID=1837375 RepID=UPI00193A5118|nr:hypothetical protein [Aurantibacter crassamenti]MBM1107007.1 hypothetical protein [Aurantibacter crassamenti]